MNDKRRNTAYYRNIVKPLIKLRHDRGISLERLNRHLDMALNYVHKWECAMKRPSTFNLYCWAQALGAELVLEPYAHNDSLQGS